MSKNKRPSSEEILTPEEMFYAIRQEAIDNKCPVTVHKKLAKINGSNGYFSSEPSPHIKVAIGGGKWSAKEKWPKAVQLLVHEYCHFVQWKTGFLGHKDDEGNIAYARQLEGETLTPRERKMASTLVRISEYDCEMRAAELLKKWNIESIFPVEKHIKSSNTYNRHIVWSIGDETYPGSGEFYAKYDSLADELWGNKVFRRFWDPETLAGERKLLAPISRKHLEIFDRAAGISRDREGNSIKRKTAAKRRRR